MKIDIKFVLSDCKRTAAGLNGNFEWKETEREQALNGMLKTCFFRQAPTGKCSLYLVFETVVFWLSINRIWFIQISILIGLFFAVSFDFLDNKSTVPPLGP
jgi:hypothetical protein